MPHETMMIDDAVACGNEELKKECSTCRWWSRARPAPGTNELWGMDMFPFGECRGAPPTALASDRKQMAQNDPSGETYVVVKQARFPHTFPDDWCGMWTEGL